MILNAQKIEKISSYYLKEGHNKDLWHIDKVEIIENTLLSRVRMLEYYISNTDNNAFHLSYLTALEFVSQLQIIFMHSWAGLELKTKEVWMIECRMKSHKIIKNPHTINVEMIATKMFKRSNIYYCIADHRVTDDQDGFFEIRIKSVMP
jgi:hypothetical protein